MIRKRVYSVKVEKYHWNLLLHAEHPLETQTGSESVSVERENFKQKVILLSYDEPGSLLIENLVNNYSLIYRKDINVFQKMQQNIVKS